jgi:hypothetical protein
MPRFEDTGSLGDLEYEKLQTCLNKIPNLALRFRSERFKSLNLFELAVHAEYMRRNLTPKDEIIYEGAVREHLLPELIFRITEHLDVRELVRGLLES